MAQALNSQRFRAESPVKPENHCLTRSHQRFLSDMNKMSLRGNWNEIKGKLKQKYANLTDSDLTFIEGKEEELLGRLQQRTGQTREQLRQEIEKL
jgi:uncharacterized protein YjbJ (UPF0337 family)